MRFALEEQVTHRLFTYRIALMASALLLLGCAVDAERRHAGTSRHELSVGGVKRHYLLYTPQGVEHQDGVRPLVVVLHGGGGTALGIARELSGTMHRLADREGFYVAYPDAIDKMWDFGAGKVSEELKSRVDDRAYFEQVLNEAIGRLPIDETRVFATGISRGGQASYFIACSFPRRIRAIAAVAMPLPRFMADMCTDGPPVGVAVMNGTHDPLVPYDGGHITIRARKRGEVLSTDATISLWLRRNGCDEEPTDREIIDTSKADGMLVEKKSWGNCRGAPVLLYRVEGGGHTWPSGRQYLPAFLVGPVNHDIDGAAEAWAFFRDL